MVDQLDPSHNNDPSNPSSSRLGTPQPGSENDGSASPIPNNSRQSKPSITLDDLKSDPRFQNLEPSLPKNIPVFQCVKAPKNKSFPSKRALFCEASVAYGNPTLASATPLQQKRANEMFFYSGVLDKEKRVNELYHFRVSKRAWNKIVPSVEKVMPPQGIVSDLIVRDLTKELPPAEEGAEKADAQKSKGSSKKSAAASKKKKGKDSAASGAPSPFEGLSLISYAHHGCQSLVKCMYEFDLNAKKWKAVAPTGDFPPPSHGHSILYHKPTDAMVMFGGCAHDNLQQSFNSVYICLVAGPPQPKQKKKKKKKKKIGYVWEQVVFEGAVPEARYGHVALWLDQDHMLIHGGTNGTQNFDDVWVFNVPDRKWIQIETRAESDEHRPTGGRYHHGACMIGRTLWISFGVPFNSDVFSLDLPENLHSTGNEAAQWNRYTLKGESIPSRRWGHNMLVHSKGTGDQLPSFLIMFGSNIVGKYHGDCWMLSDPKAQVQVGNDEES